MKKDRYKEEIVLTEELPLRSQSKSKKRRKKTKGNSVQTSLKHNYDIFSHNLKTKPKKTIKRLLIKVGLYVWSAAVLLSILSLLGFPVTSWFHFHSSPTDEFVDTTSQSRVLRASDVGKEEDKSDFWSSLSNNLLILTDLTSDEDNEAQIEETDELDEEIIDIPAQILPETPKQGNQLNKKLERELACEEEDCSTACKEKIKPKCARSASCKRDRERICKRRCRKRRCEDRCKDEPKFGYVEREQRMEKCKDDCSGTTAVHNKCIKKCHSQFKPCKSRCHEVAGKYACKRIEPKSKALDLDSLFDDDEDI